MTTLQFFTLLHLILTMPYHCAVAVRAPGWQNMGVNPAHGAIVYGGSCIQSFWLTIGHPTLDWFTA